MQAAGNLLEATRRMSRIGRRGRPIGETLHSWRDALVGTPAKKRRVRKWATWGGPPLLIALLVGGWLLFGPVRQPDYRKDSLKKIFNFTLLTEEFNRLPVEKRMELIGQLVQRMKDMSAGDSVVLAAFAAGIAGEARKHIEENISRLMIDLWDKHSQEYQKVKPEDQAAFLDKTMIDFVRQMEAVSGESANKSDAELLSDIRRQAARDGERMRQGRGVPPPTALGRIFQFMHGNVGSHATNDQKPRGQMMMRDMMRHFRSPDHQPSR